MMRRRLPFVETEAKDGDGGLARDIVESPPLAGRALQLSGSFSRGIWDEQKLWSFECR